MNIQDQLIVSSIKKNFLGSLVQSLQSVYLPAANKESQEVCSQLKDLTAAANKLLANFRITKPKGEADLLEFKDISSLAEECSFWEDLAGTSMGSDSGLESVKEEAKHIIRNLSKAGRRVQRPKFA